MAFALNLRADLAKLSDEELADRFEQASMAHEEAKRNLRDSWTYRLFSVRGPIRHPRAYRFLSVLLGTRGEPSFLVVFIAFVFSHKRYESYLNPPNWPDIHLNMCELKDIVDEIERRVRYRKASAA